MIEFTEQEIKEREAKVFKPINIITILLITLINNTNSWQEYQKLVMNFTVK